MNDEKRNPKKFFAVPRRGIENAAFDLMGFIKDRFRMATRKHFAKRVNNEHTQL